MPALAAVPTGYPPDMTPTEDLQAVARAAQALAAHLDAAHEQAVAVMRLSRPTELGALHGSAAATAMALEGLADFTRRLADAVLEGTGSTSRR